MKILIETFQLLDVRFLDKKILKINVFRGRKLCSIISNSYHDPAEPKTLSHFFESVLNYLFSIVAAFIINLIINRNNIKSKKNTN